MFVLTRLEVGSAEARVACIPLRPFTPVCATALAQCHVSKEGRRGGQNAPASDALPGLPSHRLVWCGFRGIAAIKKQMRR
jgi:hypothetical protein